MEESNKRNPQYLNYYIDEDYDEVLEKLPLIIKDAERKASKVLEPTIYEKKEVMAVIKNFIKEKNRKVYGGTALNETLKVVDPNDAIYDEYDFPDIEFYSPTPVQDLVDLCNVLYEKKYKYVIGKEAQHEDTYTIFVNFQLYCDISAVPLRVYNGIQTINLDGINYVHPHFMLIDYLRMINQPLTAASLRWEKAFKRMFKLLKNYPLQYYNKPLKIPRPLDEIKSYLTKIKEDFMAIPEIQQTCLIGGFEAYNFYIRHAMGDRNVEQMARATYDESKLASMVTNIPQLEFISVNYRDDVERLYNYIKGMVSEPKEITINEYFPLFQFTNFSVTINYKNVPLVSVYEADGYCVPSVKTTRGYMYISFQYLMMMLLIHKFRTHLDKNREMYFNYGIALSNLINARNIYLKKHNLGVINNTIFGEFRTYCVGSTISYQREGLLRGVKKIKEGKSTFRYNPEQFFNSSPESQARFDPSRYSYNNTSGNKITKDKNLMFKLDENGNIFSDTNVEIEQSSGEENSEASRVSSNYRNSSITDFSDTEIESSDFRKFSKEK